MVGPFLGKIPRNQVWNRCFNWQSTIFHHGGASSLWIPKSNRFCLFYHLDYDSHNTYCAATSTFIPIGSRYIKGMDTRNLGAQVGTTSSFVLTQRWGWETVSYKALQNSWEISIKWDMLCIKYNYIAPSGGVLKDNHSFNILKWLVQTAFFGTSCTFLDLSLWGLSA